MINGYLPACLRMLKFQRVAPLFLFIICMMLLLKLTSLGFIFSEMIKEQTVPQ